MIVVCDKVAKELDKVWCRLETVVHAHNPGISQIDLDELCVNYLADFVTDLDKTLRTQ